MVGASKQAKCTQHHLQPLHMAFVPLPPWLFLLAGGPAAPIKAEAIWAPRTAAADCWLLLPAILPAATLPAADLWAATLPCCNRVKTAATASKSNCSPPAVCRADCGGASRVAEGRLRPRRCRRYRVCSPGLTSPRLARFARRPAPPPRDARRLRRQQNPPFRKGEAHMRQYLRDASRLAAADGANELRQILPAT